MEKSRAHNLAQPGSTDTKEVISILIPEGDHMYQMFCPENLNGSSAKTAKIHYMKDLPTNHPKTDQLGKHLRF